MLDHIKYFATGQKEGDGRGGMGE